MAINPMKRRENTALIIGFVIGLALTIVVGAIGYKKYSDKKKELNALKAKQSQVVVAANDIDSGASLSEDDFVIETVMTTMSLENTFTDPSEFLGSFIVMEDEEKDNTNKTTNTNTTTNTTTNEDEEIDEETDEEIDEETDEETPEETEEETDEETTETSNEVDNEKTEKTEKTVEEDVEEEGHYEAAAKIAIPAGTIITKSMITSLSDALTNDKRLQEYSSIALPSELKTGDYIDIRFELPTGQDYIVLSKKEVINTNESTVWLNVNESEILLLNSAMVEAWTITGTKLYAIEYVDAGMQDSAKVTYKPSAEVTDLINANPNITKDAREGLSADLNSLGRSYIVDQFRDYIDSTLSEHIEDRENAVKSGFDSEITKMQEHRAEYIEELGE